MCNRYKFHLPLERLAEDFSSIKIPLRFSDDARSLNADIAITDLAPIVRMEGDSAKVDMLRWSWPQSGTNKRPVFNFVSEGRRFPAATRCLIPATAFYEFTDTTEPGKRTKDRWLFTVNDTPIFGIAGKWVHDPVNDEPRWTMLTAEPGPDIAPIHDRQIVVLTPDQWGPWLRGDPETDLLKPSPRGTLSAEMG
jgi:putative SOS response-associated peptidase YedK